MCSSKKYLNTYSFLKLIFKFAAVDNEVLPVRTPLHNIC